MSMQPHTDYCLFSHELEDQLPLALAAIEKLLVDNAWRGKAWRDQGEEGNWKHGRDHVHKMENDRVDDEDHLLHSACRFLMQLQLRQEKRLFTNVERLKEKH